TPLAHPQRRTGTSEDRRNRPAAADVYHAHGASHPWRLDDARAPSERARCAAGFSTNRTERRATHTGAAASRARLASRHANARRDRFHRRRRASEVHLTALPPDTETLELKLSNGLHMRAYARGNGPRTVLLLHGFPELALSWRAQLAAAPTGFRLVAP